VIDPDHRERMERKSSRSPGTANQPIKIPVGDILRLVSKMIRYSKGGFTPEERRDLVGDLLELAAQIAERG
jgi:hypothetical protein